MTGREATDSPPVIRWCWCGAAVAGMTVVEARQFARDHCDAGRVPSCACCGEPVAEARPPYCQDCHDKGCP